MRLRHRQNGWIGAAFATAIVLFAAPAAHAVDPPYQSQMERLAGIMGSLYFLQPLCGSDTIDWRAQMADLIARDEPDEDRRARLAGAFNSGYRAYERTYRTCTPSARIAIERLLAHGETAARDIHSRYAD